MNSQLSLVIDTVEFEGEEQFGKSVTNNKWRVIIELLRSSCLLQMIFDPTMSKKKKKKKKPFMLDDEGGGDTQTEETQQSETKEVEPEPTEDKDVEADEEDSRKKGKVNPCR